MKKPEFNSPCNGCGQCCKAEACNLSRDLLKSEATPCIALEFDNNRYWCVLVRNPGVYLDVDNGLARRTVSPIFAYMLGLGVGCDSTFPASEVA